MMVQKFTDSTEKETHCMLLPTSTPFDPTWLEPEHDQPNPIFILRASSLPTLCFPISSLPHNGQRADLPIRGGSTKISFQKPKLQSLILQTLVAAAGGGWTGRCPRRQLQSKIQRLLLPWREPWR